jgi:predicted phosphodiesterase
MLILAVVCGVPGCADYALAQSGSEPLLALPPLLGRPTSTSMSVNLVAADADLIGRIRYRAQAAGAADAWRQTAEVALTPYTPVHIDLTGLKPGAAYDYQVHARRKSAEQFESVQTSRFTTRPAGAAAFSFALATDAHLTPFHQDRLDIFARASASIRARGPAFLALLGDNIQTFGTHGGPMTEERFGPALYAILRRGLGETAPSIPVFVLNGNWEGENGWHPENQRQWAIQARKAFIPNPRPDTYPQGGGMDQDYYGFTWGDALFIVLNVTGYTTIDHAHSGGIGQADDWTLGETQRNWLHDRLKRSREKWKFILIHHTVGGNAGDDVNSRYGRGGGRAAHVGEQAVIHGWMKQYGVQALFYGHDHVFTDQVVDGIHYICAGSVGAPWKFGQNETGYDRFWTPSGYTWVEVTPEKMTVAFIEPGDAPDADKVLHSFEIAGR